MEGDCRSVVETTIVYIFVPPHFAGVREDSVCMRVRTGQRFIPARAWRRWGQWRGERTGHRLGIRSWLCDIIQGVGEAL